MEESECQCEHDGEVKEVKSDIDYFSSLILVQSLLDRNLIFQSISVYVHILRFRVRFLLLTPFSSLVSKRSFLA